MSLFNKKNKNNDYEGYYDEDGYFIDTSNNNIPYENNMYNENYNNGYENNYNNYDDNTNNYNYDEDEKFKLLRKRKKENLDYNAYYNHYKEEVTIADVESRQIIKQKVNVKIITLVILYIVFLLFGTINTTFISGYKAQIITPTLRGKREIFDKTYKSIEFLTELENFGGSKELQDITKSGQYTSRISPLKLSLNKITKEIKRITDVNLKIKDKDVLKHEMVQMSYDLLVTNQQLLQLVIKYYETVTGYTDLSNSQIVAKQNELIDGFNVLFTKFNNYKDRFEQIKVYELLLE